MTEQSQVPLEPDGTQPAPAADESGLSQDERAELERLRAETAALHGQAGAHGRRRHFSWRATVSIVLIVLGCVIAPVAVLGVWAGNEVSNTGRWVATVEPLIHDPAIQNVLTDKITKEITSQLNLTSVINQASTQLNSKGLTRISSLLTTFGPQITSAVNGFIQSTVHTVITSQAVANIWVQVNTIAHQAVVRVLSGQGGGALSSTSNGEIVLNLGPIVAQVKQDLLAHGFSLASNIPAVSPTLALFQAKDLGKAQAGYRLITTLKIVLPILVLVLLGAGVWVARGRRRALVGAGLGLAGSMLVLAIGLLIARSIYLSSVPSSVLPPDAAAAAFDAMVHFIKEGLRAVLALGLVVAIGAYFTGPSRAAIATRSGIKSGIEWIRHYGERRGVSTGPVGEWTYLHRNILRIGAVALFAIILVFWGEPTALLVIVLVILLLVVLGLIELIGRPPAEPKTAAPA
ncbi:MAG TPA: hypothetical protein VK284_01160 [Streptosporangiaceae bacterium]|nr:hypothetical protein [Streptosporangiaceae bacterium]HLN68616.1 hypothetical protein [Streptosporangiaceae bacterium]